jgi:hypothetical protein
MIADPLHLLDCCVITTAGAGGHQERARDSAQKPVHLGAAGGQTLLEHRSMPDFTEIAVMQSVRGAGHAGASEADTLQPYDSFTITVP